MHHLLLSEEPDLRLIDLLSIESNDATSQPPATESDADQEIKKSPLTDIVSYPVHIPELLLQLQVAFTNLWNEFLSKYDALSGDISIRSQASCSEFPFIDEPKPMASQQRQIATLTDFFAALLISVVTVFADFCKGFHATRHHPLIKWKFFSSLVNRENRKRSFSWKCFFKALITSLNPFNVVKSSIGFACSTAIYIAIKWPQMLYREYLAFRCCFFDGYAGYPNTLIGFLFAYIPLLYNTVKEILRYLAVFVEAPRFMYEELIQHRSTDEHVLQNISMCGRKILSWSTKINVTDVRRACIKHALSPTEIYMSAASAALTELLKEFETFPVPKEIRVFASRRIQDYLRGKLNVDDSETGHLCLKLPMSDVSHAQLKQIGDNFSIARENQIGLYYLFLMHKRFNILTKFLPSFYTVILFNYLSRRFTVSITEITKGKNNLFAKGATATCWGHKILDVLYFSPPQSNGSE